MDCVNQECSLIFLCKHVKKSEEQQSSHSCAELSKSQFFSVSIVNTETTRFYYSEKFERLTLEVKR